MTKDAQKRAPFVTLKQGKVERVLASFPFIDVTPRRYHSPLALTLRARFN